MMRALLAASITIAGCASPASSSTAQPTAGPAASGPATSVATTSIPGDSLTTTQAPGSTAPAFTGDACDLLTDADVLELTGYPVATKGPTPIAYASTCLWTLNGVAWDIALGIDPSGGGSGYDRLVELNGGGTEIPGLGERAIRLQTTNNPIAQLGTALYDLQFTGFGEPDGLDVLLLERVLDNVTTR